MLTDGLLGVGNNGAPNGALLGGAEAVLPLRVMLDAFCGWKVPCSAASASSSLRIRAAVAWLSVIPGSMVEWLLPSRSLTEGLVGSRIDLTLPFGPRRRVPPPFEPLLLLAGLACGLEAAAAGGLAAGSAAPAATAGGLVAGGGAAASLFATGEGASLAVGSFSATTVMADMVWPLLGR